MQLLMLVQVQAHVAHTEVDPGAAVAWLQVTDQGMEASPKGSQLIRCFSEASVQSHSQHCAMCCCLSTTVLALLH